MGFIPENTKNLTDFASAGARGFTAAQNRVVGGAASKRNGAVTKDATTLTVSADRG